MAHDLHDIKEIIIHHSASNPKKTTWKTIRRWHLLRFKWGIGYHRITEFDGTSFDGRRVQVQGAHAPPNANRIGICLTGWNGNAEHPEWKWSGAQWRSLIIDLHHLLAVHPKAMILGHNDTKATLCPGLKINKELKKRGIPAANLIGE